MPDVGEVCEAKGMPNVLAAGKRVFIRVKWGFLPISVLEVTLG
jgi:hypothetical protein